MANFDLSNLALQAVCPGNELLYDDKGMPSVMVRIPKMTYKDLGMGSSTAVHPAFIVTGTEVDEIWISKYQNIVHDERAYSLPAVDPKSHINFDEARAVCADKGEGWHLMTRMEWGLLVRWCQNNGVMPKGNNNFGRHYSENVYKAVPSMNKDSYGRTQRTATGTGPLTWTHDQSPTGIVDLCGNVWEWTGGIRTVSGELQIFPNNNGADGSLSQSVNSNGWKAIRASDGALVTPTGSGATVKLDWVDNKLTYSMSITDASPGTHTSTFGDIACTSAIGDATKLLLQSLGLLMYGENSELFAGHQITFDNASEERMLFAGGAWNGSSAGLASFYGQTARDYASTGFGFRSAYVKLPTA